MLYGFEELKYQQVVVDKFLFMESGYFKYEVKCFQIFKLLIRVDYFDISYDDRILEE